MNHQLSSSNSLLPDTPNTLSKEFSVSVQTELFTNLKQVKFSGQLILTNARGSKWTVYLNSGHVFYANGGIHAVKRWYRNLTVFLPEHISDIAKWETEATQADKVSIDDGNRCWQYQLLCSWVQQKKITREQATKIVWSTLVESWFDATQSQQTNYELKQLPSSSKGIILLDGNRVVAEVERQRLAWQKAQVDNLNLNQAPVISQVDQMQQSTSARVFEMLSNLLDGQKTLRDLGIEMERKPLTVTCFLLPYIQSGLVELINVPDLPVPVLATFTTAIEQPLIACVDDSPLICNSMEKFLTDKGYRFTGINDPLRAFSVLLALKPDLIFLDLMMPNTNGYEVCEKLRRIAHFRNTPIVILTGNDGVVDRLKAKMVGASGFLSKNRVDAVAVTEVLNKHLRHCTLSQLKLGASSGLASSKNVA
ncbi:MAG: response regulator [Hyellaceae cyanobacterium CSU_1_1]|nr:response regulator [Pleurocapsa sp. CRU_1_2]NJR45764.1 response regulator [Hyellaceae cyanobacterium CSU_1_1]